VRFVSTVFRSNTPSSATVARARATSTALSRFFVPHSLRACYEHWEAPEVPLSLSIPPQPPRARPRRAPSVPVVPSLPFDAIAEAVPSLVWSADRSGRVDYVNGRWRELTGASPKDALGAGWAAFLHPDDRRRERRLWMRALRGGATLDTEVRLRRFDGRWRWHQVRSRPVADGNGHWHRIVGTATDIEDRRSLAAKLSAEREKIERVLRPAPLIVSSVDADGKVVFCDGKGLKAAGLRKDELLGRSFFEVFGARSRPLVTAMRRALDGEANTCVAEVFDRWYETLFAPIRSEHGYVDGVACVSTDITGQKRAEDRLRSALHAADMGYWEYDLVASTFTCNARTLELFGLRSESWDGSYDALLRRVHPDDLERKRRAFDEAVATCSDYDIEYRTLVGTTVPADAASAATDSPEGGPPGELHHRWIAAKGRCITNAQGMPMRFTGVVFDVTEKRRTVDQLEESEERFRLAAWATTGIVYDWDLRTQSVWRSEGFFGLLGFAPHEVDTSAEWWRDRIHPEDLDMLQEWLRDVFEATGEHFDHRYRVRHREGHYLHVHDRG
jgi:PAS domain S-box-containing protein